VHHVLVIASAHNAVNFAPHFWQASKAALAKMDIERKAREQFFKDQEARWQEQVEEAAEKAKAEAAANLAAHQAKMAAQLKAAEEEAQNAIRKAAAAAELAAQATAVRHFGRPRLLYAWTHFPCVCV